MKHSLKKFSPVAWFMLGILVAGGTGTAYAANGGTFRLGQSNSATATTKLTNTTGTALKVLSKAGTPPISVGSNSTKVPYFNADKLDGKDSTSFASSSNPQIKPIFAVIKNDGTILRQTGGVTVTHPSTGIWCVRVPGYDSANWAALVSNDYQWNSEAIGASSQIARVQYRSTPFDCTTKSDFEIATSAVSLGSVPAVQQYSDEGFSFAVAR